ncbi:60Kd inner membrane protein-domain-containing protein [Trametes punicea]|nr:60Kd inner membrane protein-domain-containing protein [Trametes punicea]
MMMCMGSAGRMGIVGLRAARPVLNASQARCLSTFSLQRHRVMLGRSEFPSTQRRALSLWPFSKSPAPVEKTEPAPPEIVPETTTTPEPVAVEASATLDAASSVPSPDAALPPVSVPTDALPTEIVSSIPPLPLHYGDLAALGLASWTPAGLCRWGMELIQVSTGMPWFWTIVSATVVSRLILFPLAVKQLRSTAALAPYQSEIAELRDQMAEAQKKRDTVAMQRVALRQQLLHKKAGVSMVDMVLSPLVQFPVTLGMFFGVKKLCDFPLEQLKYSGFQWVPDLTVADPTWTLPIIATVLMNVQIFVSMRDLVGQTPQMGHIMNYLRILTAASVFLMANLSSGVVVYLISSIVLMITQSLVLRQPAVRRLLGIPLIRIEHRQPAPSMRESLQYARKWWNDKIADARAANRP